MIEFPQILGPDGSPLVRQLLLRPAVYLDTWALIEIAESATLAARFRDALAARNGTLVFSQLTLADLVAMKHARVLAVAEFIDGLAPRWFLADFNAFFVEQREWDVMAKRTAESPAGDVGVLRLIAEEAQRNGGRLTVRTYLEEVKAHEPSLRAMRDQLGLAVFKGLEALRARVTAEPGVGKDIDNALRIPDRPRSTSPLLRVLLESLYRDVGMKPNPNTGIDFMHSVVPAAYCDLVAVDAQWHQRISSAARRMKKAKLSAPVARTFAKKSGGVVALIGALETFRDSGAARPPA